jgi:hypothetical protein
MIFEGKKLLNIKCVFLFSVQLLSETLPILTRNKLGVIKMYIGLHVKYSSLLFDFNET